MFSTLCLWSMSKLIYSWFFKFILYEFKWMYLYLKGSQPWHVARKWYTCKSFVYFGWRSTKVVCHYHYFWDYGRCLLVLYSVSCIRWIVMVRPLCFALYTTNIIQRAVSNGLVVCILHKLGHYGLATLLCTLSRGQHSVFGSRELWDSSQIFVPKILPPDVPSVTMGVYHGFCA